MNRGADATPQALLVLLGIGVFAVLLWWILRRREEDDDEAERELPQANTYRWFIP